MPGKLRKITLNGVKAKALKSKSFFKAIVKSPPIALRAAGLTMSRGELSKLVKVMKSVRRYREFSMIHLFMMELSAKGIGPWPVD
jgi:hypothetical protein